MGTIFITQSISQIKQLPSLPLQSIHQIAKEINQKRDRNQIINLKRLLMEPQEGARPFLELRP